MTYLLLFIYFFYIGAVALGGGLVIFPFLEKMAEKTSWFTLADLSNIVALAEITPGAIGVNMATYAGYATTGWAGALTASVGIVAPALLITGLVWHFWQKMHQSKPLSSLFNAMKCAVIGLLFGVALSLFLLIFQGVAYGGETAFRFTLFALLFLIVLRFRPSPIFYLIGMGIAGILLEL